MDRPPGLHRVSVVPGFQQLKSAEFVSLGLRVSELLLVLSLVLLMVCL